MHKNNTNRMMLTFLLKTCLRLSACLLIPLLITAGMLQALDGLGGKISVVLANGEPTVFTDVTTFAGVDLTSPQWGAVWGDYDGDDHQDLHVGHYYNTPNLYRNDGDGTFTDRREAAGLKSGPGHWHSAAWGDANNDDNLDLYVVVGEAVVDGSDFYVNNGDGTFTERAVAAGVTNDDGRGRTPRWVDYDLDGDLDIFIANAARDIAPNVLYRNNNDGTFTEVAAQADVATSDGSSGVSWADYDGDGDPDFVLIMIGRPVRLYRNQGDGTFVETADSALLGGVPWPSAAAWGDYDNDGDLDLYMGLSYDDYQDRLVWDSQAITVVVRTPLGGGQEGLVFTTTVPTVTFDLWQSYGRLDPADITYGSGNQHPPLVPFTLYSGTEHIGQPSYTPGEDFGVFIWRDSITAPWNIYWSGNNERLLGTITTAGEFTEVVPIGFDAHSQPSRPNRLYRNNGDGTLTRIESSAGVADTSNTYDAQWVDFDNDGYLDLFVTNFGDTHMGNQPNRLYQNNGDGTFTDVLSATGDLAVLNPGNDACSAWADYDDDGFLDLFLSNSSYDGFLAGPHKLYRNGGNANHWLQIKLNGTRSNRLGIGARIQVTTGDLTQFREVGVSASGPCHNSLLAHFGLGGYTQAEIITVTWPSGYVQVLYDVPVDQILEITESRSADLTIAKTHSAIGAVQAGERVTYTLTLANAGPTTPVTATVVDTFSDAGGLAGVSGPGCTWTPGSTVVTCTLSDVSSDAPTYLTLLVTTNRTYSGTLTNTATVTPAGDVTDPLPSNNSTGPVAVTVTQPQADLAIAKARSGTGNVQAGERVTYTLTVTNAGPTSPVIATVVDTFSDAEGLAGVSGPGCVWTPGSTVVTCTMSDLVVDMPAHLTLLVTTSGTYSGTLTNTATVTPTGDVTDPNPSDNSTAPVTVIVAQKHMIYMPMILR